jgi:hypothetical protein
METAVGLAHITIVDWILIIIFSGLAAAVLNQLGASLIGVFQAKSQERLQKGEQAFKERLQRDEREDQSLQLLIAAHFDQREKSLKDAVDVREWVWLQSYTLYGPDHDYYGDHEPPANITTIADALSALNRIAYFHPTRSIRARANNLGGSIAGHFNSINDDFSGIGGKPSEEQLEKWLDSADEIIELIHTPPSLDEIRHPGSDIATQPPVAH